MKRNAMKYLLLVATALLPCVAFAQGTTSTSGGGIPLGQKGAANGVATLDGGGQVPGSQLGNAAGLARVGSIVTSGASVQFSGSVNYLEINKTVGSPTAVTLPAAPSAWVSYTVKDWKGDAAINNITVLPVSGTIDGLASFVMVGNYQSTSFVFDGTNWGVE